MDATTNLDQGNKAYVKGLMDKYISADMKLDDSAACATVMAAVNSRDPVTCTATFGTGTTAITITGSMMVFGAELSAGLEDVPSMTVTCRPAPAAGSSSSSSSGGATG